MHGGCVLRREPSTSRHQPMYSLSLFLSLSFSLSVSHKHTFSVSLTLTLSHSLTHIPSLSLCISLSLTLTLSHTHPLSLTSYFPLLSLPRFLSLSLLFSLLPLTSALLTPTQSLFVHGWPWIWSKGTQANATEL